MGLDDLFHSLGVPVNVQEVQQYEYIERKCAECDLPACGGYTNEDGSETYLCRSHGIVRARKVIAELQESNDLGEDTDEVEE